MVTIAAYVILVFSIIAIIYCVADVVRNIFKWILKR